MTCGVDGATLRISARVGAAMTSGGMVVGLGLAGRDGIALALRRHALDDLAVDGRGQARGEEARVVLGDRVDHVDDDLDDRLLAGAELRLRVLRGDDDHVGRVRPETRLGRSPILASPR